LTNREAIHYNLNRVFIILPFNQRREINHGKTL